LSGDSRTVSGGHARTATSFAFAMAAVAVRNEARVERTCAGAVRLLARIAVPE
jgi:hypothetical protein